MIVGTARGRFPRGTPPETPEDKRRRWEDWLIETRRQALARPWRAGEEKDGQHLDPEYDAVMYQPNRSPSVSRPSVKLAIRARCWQCVAGDCDEGGTTRIGACRDTGCALWSVRPYQGEEKVKRLKRADVQLGQLHPNDHGAKALANPGNMRLAVRGYCHQCCGGQPTVGTMREINACGTAICALWRIRPGAQTAEDGENAENPGNADGKPD